MGVHAVADANAIAPGPRKLELLILCQTPGCGTPLAIAHVPAGCFDVMCVKCVRVTRFQVTDGSMSVVLVPPSTKLSPR